MNNPVWRKSSYSNAQGGDCVEVAQLPDAIGVRDSKNPDGGNLALSSATFRTLLTNLKHGNPTHP